MRSVDSPVKSVTMLGENMKQYYPELYGFMFGDFSMPYTALSVFKMQHNINSRHGIAEYQRVWDYIRENEHMHEWWML